MRCERLGGQLSDSLRGFAALVGSNDGYRLLVSGSDGMALGSYFSADGSTWTKTPTVPDGYVIKSGVLNGNAVVLLGTLTGTTLLVGAPGGGWSAFDIGTSIGTASPTTPARGGVLDAAIGPLGIAMTVSSGDGLSLVESADGSQF